MPSFRVLATAALLLPLLALLATAHAAYAEDEPATYAGRDAAWWLEQLKIRKRAPAAYVAFQVIGEDGYPVLARALRERDPTFRAKVARALYLAKGDYTPILPDLVRALEDESMSVRRLVVKILRHLGPKAKPAVPALVRLLEDSRSDVAKEAALTLAAIGEAASEAEDALIDALHGDVSVVQQAAAGALPRIAPASDRTLEALGVALDTEDVQLRRKIAESLFHVAPDAPSLLPLVRLVRADPDAGVRRCATKVLLQMAQTDDRVVSDLTALVAEDPSAEVVIEAAAALAALGEKAVPAIPVLIDRLPMPKADYRIAAALHALHPWSVGPLADALADDDPTRVELAAYVLRQTPRERLRAVADRMVPGLRRMVGDGSEAPHPSWQQAVLLAIQVADASPDVLAFLLDLHAHPSSTVRNITVINLVRLQGASHPALLEMLASEVASERAFAFRALGSTGRVVRVEGAKEVLLSLLDHPWPDVRHGAVLLLTGASSPYAVHLGEGSFVSGERREIIAESLARMIEAEPLSTSLHGALMIPLLGAKSVVAIPVLVAATSHPEFERAHAAATALAQVARFAATPPTANLLSRLRDAEEKVVSGAVLALALLGHDAEALLPTIHRLLESVDDGVRQKAKAALEAIEMRDS